MVDFYVFWYLIFFFCFAVAICDLVHDVAAILLLTASGFFSEI